MMLTSAASATSRIRGMYRPSPGAVGSTIVLFVDEKPDYLLISNRVLPALLEAGVTQEQIDQMMVANPVAFFGGRASGGAAEAGLAHYAANV